MWMTVPSSGRVSSTWKYSCLSKVLVMSVTLAIANRSIFILTSSRLHLL